MGTRSMRGDVPSFIMGAKFHGQAEYRGDRISCETRILIDLTASSVQPISTTRDTVSVYVLQDGTR